MRTFALSALVAGTAAAARPEGRVLAERAGTAPGVRRERLVRAEGKVPLLRVEETAAGRRRAMAADQILVRLHDGADDAAAAALADHLGGRVRRRLRAPGFYLIGLPRADLDAVPAALTACRRRPDLARYAEPDAVPELHDTAPNDPYFTNGSLWGHTRIRLPGAWDAHTGGTGTVVAVIDTGADYAHPDLAANIWINPRESGLDAQGRNRATNGVDDDGNGYVDDVRGWDCYYEDNNPADGHTTGHGTRCAGQIGAVGNNAMGVVGACWQVRVLPIKMWSDAGAATMADALESFQYALAARTNGVNLRVISVSWGFDSSEAPDALRELLDACRQAGILVAVSAGNNNVNLDATPYYPAAFDLDNLIVAAATTAADTRWGSSNYSAAHVDLGAPGETIWSTVPGSSYGNSTGTSRASPYVAGVVALVADLYPRESAGAIRAAVLAGVDPLPALQGLTATGGRLNALGAMLKLPPSLAHTPLANTTNTASPYAVETDIVPAALVDTNAAWVAWNTTGATNAWATNRLVRLSGNRFRAELPAQPLGTCVYYQLAAANRSGAAARHPSAAPAELHTFRVVPPVALSVTGNVAAAAVSPPYGEHLFPSGVTVTASAPAVVPLGAGERYALTGWTGGGSVPAAGATGSLALAIGEASTLAWNWELQHALRQTSSVPGAADTTAWCAATGLCATARAPDRTAAGATNFAFAEWRIDGARWPADDGEAANPAAGIPMPTSRVALAVYVPESLDTDGDGLPDWWEARYFGGAGASPTNDADADGFPETAEFADRSNPRDPAAAPTPPHIAGPLLGSPQTLPPPYAVQAAVTDNVGVASAVLWWQRNGGPWQAAPMAVGASNRYEAAIGGAAADGDTFAARVVAADPGGNTATGAAAAFVVDYPRPRIAAGGATGTVVLAWAGAAGGLYSLDARTSLAAAAAWQPLSGASNLPGGGADMAWTARVEQARERYYRLGIRRR